MTDDHKGAILQRDNETFAIVPRTPVGLVTPDVLENMAQVVRKYKIPVAKITSGQRLALVGIKEEDLDSVWQDLQMDVGRAIELCLHYVQACPGTSVCKFGVQDSLEMGMELEEIFHGQDLPAKMKIGVSGCPLCCGESMVRDIGFIGKKKGWTVVFGGNAGRRPRVGDILAEDLDRGAAVDLVQKCVDYYQDNGKKKERTARFIERTGIEAMKASLFQ